MEEPLSLNYLQQTRELLQSIPDDIAVRFRAEVHDVQAAISPTVQPVRLLQALSNALSIPVLSWHVARTFQPILLDLAARWLDGSGVSMDQLYSLAFLVEVHEDLYPYAHTIDQPDATGLHIK